MKVSVAKPTSTLTGVALVIGAVFFFAVMDSTTKHLSARYSIPMVIAIRYMVNLAVLVLLFGPSAGRSMFRAERRGLVLVRSGCLAAASLFAGLALQRMPVAETMAIVFLAPVVVAIASRPVLGETIGPVGWVAALAGFAGVLLIARPGGGLDPWGVAAALGCAAATVIYNLLSRLLARSETTASLLFHATLAGTVVFGAMLPWTWGGPAPSPLDLTLFGAMGFLAGTGHWLFTAAFRHAPASLLAPVQYLQLAFGGVLGWAVFGHLPDAPALAGMAIIAAAGIAVSLRSGRTPR